MDHNARIYIAGHRGLVGSALMRRLAANGYSNIITRRHAELDLTNQAAVQAFFAEQRPEYVFLAAAKVGGIWANQSYPADFLYDNLAIETNVIHAAFQANVCKLLFLGSSCIYPRDCPQPIREEYLLTGPLECTNEAYAIAKIAGIKLCASYNRQHGTDYLAVMPTNLYGPEDNFDLNHSHVLPALIRKMHLAKLAQQNDWEAIQQDEARYGAIPEDILQALKAPDGPKVRLWGTGTPKREFLYSDDLADACIFLMQHQHAKEVGECINIGTGEDQSIRELADMVAEVVGYTGEIEWDQSKPDGTPRKVLDVGRIRGLGWRNQICLSTGVKQVYRDY